MLVQSQVQILNSIHKIHEILQSILIEIATFGDYTFIVMVLKW